MCHGRAMFECVDPLGEGGHQLLQISLSRLLLLGMCVQRGSEVLEFVLYRTHTLTTRCDVVLSPVAGQLNPTDLAEWILADGLAVRFQIQLHKLLWSDARGK